MTCYDDLIQLRTKYGTSGLDDAIRKYNRSRLSVDKPEKRKRMSKSLKNELYAKQGGKCARCREPFSIHAATDDHTVALAQGGSNSKWNRRLVCAPCNSSKNANSPIKESKLGFGTIAEQIQRVPIEDEP